MSSKTTFLKLSLCLLVITFSCCIESKRIVEKIDFETTYKHSSEIEDKVANDTLPWKYQISASEYAIKGNYKNALKHWDLGFKSKASKPYSKHQIDSVNQIYRVESAIKYISEKSKYQQVIIINEAHHNSHHRLFTKSLLQELYDNGYTNLGLEALENGKKQDHLLMDRKYPIQETGFYTKDPQFGDLIRTAIDIGYDIFPYEQTTNVNGKDREIEQAKNIQKIIEKKPDEKFLIHCGFSHVLEGEYPKWEKTMSGRLKEYTGIDPLTINQTAYNERSNIAHNNPFLNALNLKESSVLINKNNEVYKYEQGKTWTDIVVFHPNTTYINDRPSWLFKNGNKNVTVSLEDINVEFPVMVLAFKMGEDINTAIPIDITEVQNKKENCHLGLKKGDYEIIVTNGNQSFKFQESVL